MNREQIEQLRADIRADYESKTEQLQAEMNSELKALSRIESRLSKSNMLEGDILEPPPFPKLITRPLIPTSPKILKIKEIIESVLDGISGEFTRKSLHEKAEERAGKTIKGGSFAPTFSDLIKAGKIIVVTKSSGSTPGKYKKAE